MSQLDHTVRVIVIHDSDSEDLEGSRSDGGVVLTTSGVATAAGRQASTGPTTIHPGAGPDVIKVDSDESEDELRSPLRKRARTGQYRRVVSCASGSPGPGPPGGSKPDDSEREHDVLYHRSKIIHGLAVEPGFIQTPLSLAAKKDYIWVTAAALLQKKPTPCRPMQRKRNYFQIGQQPYAVLELAPISASFVKAGGAINKIIQKPRCIAVSSAASGGQPDNQGTAEQPIDPYNHEGTLQIWQESKVKNSTILHGHCLSADQFHKCYTVNSVSFDPNQSQIMASAGNNGSIQLWLDDKKLDNGHYEYPMAPYDVVYREKDSLLAVTCMNGSVYVHSTQSGLLSGDPVNLCVTPPDVQQSVGSVVWGHGASMDMFFASSEAQRADDYSGFHAAFDPDQRRCAYDFSAGESGDAMALDPDGARLALCTIGPDSGSHSLRIYDVRRRNGRDPIQQVQLDAFDSAAPSSALPWSESHEDEVTSASFSPGDGLLLAVARSDDELHIYDSRFMGRTVGPMARFLHWDDDCCVGEKWGIVDAVWVDGWCGRGFGIVTGGTDGCVRFWDVRKSGEDVQNGEVLARPNVDIGHFSVGDPRSGEMPLVVGDNGGRVYVYDYATASKSAV